MKLYFMSPLEVQKKPIFVDFHPYASSIKYLQYDRNACVFSSLASSLFDARENVAEKSISSRLELSLYCA